MRPLSSDCFDVDVRLTSFFPRQNWQQAGLLLLEDTTFAGRSARVSIGYNDFSGGFPQTREVIVQAITSLGQQSSKPEEFVHQRLFVVDSTTERSEPWTKPLANTKVLARAITAALSSRVSEDLSISFRTAQPLAASRSMQSNYFILFGGL